jgi:hypothetical protein
MKLPEHFDLSVNMKRAIGNGVALLLFLKISSINDPILLGIGFVFGFLGGSANDIIGWLSNRDAIVAKKEKEKEGESQ